MAGRDVPPPSPPPILPRVPASLRDWVINKIKIGKQIGRGANGRVLEAEWEGIGVAVKEIHSIFMNEVSESEFHSFKQSFLRECEQSSRLRHPNIVRFFGIYLPPGARVPSLVMERLHCSLNHLLEETPVIPIGTKLSILYDVALGVRYLHSRNPPIIHRDLSSNNVLISMGMQGKIADLGTVRLIDPIKQSKMTTAPGTVHFMPPEALESSKYGRELDVFSFGCVMLHTLSHQWPTPLQAVITDPVTLEMKARSEVERRRSYFDGIDRSRLTMLIPLIESCLSNLPKNRPSMVVLCERLGSLVDREHVPTITSLHKEIQIKDAEITALKSDMSKLQTICSHLPSKQANKSSADFWNNLNLTWQKCADFPGKMFVTSTAELDGIVYVSVSKSRGVCVNAYMYDSDKDCWSTLPELPYFYFSVVTVPSCKQLLAIGGGSWDKGNIKMTGEVFLWDRKSRKWLTPYPDMPTARRNSSCASYGSLVIVAGGVVQDPLVMTRAVEVLHIAGTDSYWSAVEQLPNVTSYAVPLVINDNVYIAAGIDKDGESTCGIVTASLPQLLQSSSNNTGSGQVWSKLPDMPYSSWSVSHYQGHLLSFNGDHLVERPNKAAPIWKLAPLIHIYNTDVKCWDCVGKNHHEYLFGFSVHLQCNKILFLGGMTGTHSVIDDDLITTCMLLTLKSQ